MKSRRTLTDETRLLRRQTLRGHKYDQEPVMYTQAAYENAVASLRHEIELAKREAATAPLYRRWPDGI